jgi:hypothetical protein
MQHRSTRRVVLTAAAAAFGIACAAPATQREPGIAVSGGATETRMDTGARSLAQFRPARAVVIDGGDCLVTEEAAGRRMTAYFPSRSEPETVINVVVDANGRVLSYQETRGVPRPARSIEEAQAQAAQMIRTTIQLDYSTGEALAVNTAPGQAGDAIRGSVTQFHRVASLGNLREREELVRRICEP